MKTWKKLYAKPSDQRVKITQNLFSQDKHKYSVGMLTMMLATKFPY